MDDFEAYAGANKGLPNPKDAFGTKKIPLRFIPWAALASLAYVMHFGAVIKGYGWMNWRKHPVLRSVYHEAALRHLLSAMDGEDLDPESGQPHEAHVMACMAILLDAKANVNLIDDRPEPGAFGRLVQELTEKDDHQNERIAPRYLYTPEGRYAPEP